MLGVHDTFYCGGPTVLEGDDTTWGIGLVFQHGHHNLAQLQLLDNVLVDGCHCRTRRQEAGMLKRSKL